MKSNALKIDGKDSVAVATGTITKGEAVVVAGVTVCHAVEEIKPGHKVALVDIAAGQAVLRYGEPIVEASRAIVRGEWVHLHNTRPLLSAKP